MGDRVCASWKMNSANFARGKFSEVRLTVDAIVSVILATAETYLLPTPFRMYLGFRLRPPT
jgi:hypothetical protein